MPVSKPAIIVRKILSRLVKEERKEKEGGDKKEGKVCQTLGLLVAGAKHHHHHLSIYIQYLTVVQKKKPGANQGKGFDRTYPSYPVRLYTI